MWSEALGQTAMMVGCAALQELLFSSFFHSVQRSGRNTVVPGLIVLSPLVTDWWMGILWLFMSWPCYSWHLSLFASSLYVILVCPVILFQFLSCLLMCGTQSPLKLLCQSSPKRPLSRGRQQHQYRILWIRKCNSFSTDIAGWESCCPESSGGPWNAKSCLTFLV